MVAADLMRQTLEENEESGGGDEASSSSSSSKVALVLGNERFALLPARLKRWNFGGKGDNKRSNAQKKRSGSGK